MLTFSLLMFSGSRQHDHNLQDDDLYRHSYEARWKLHANDKVVHNYLHRDGEVHEDLLKCLIFT
jgi:hypothetical protein